MDVETLRAARRTKNFNLLAAYESFMARVMPEPNSGCWLWLGSLSEKGYGKIWDRDRKTNTSAHRWSYEYHKGPIPEGLQIDHLCRTRCCANPDHLEAVTAKINTNRGHAKEKFLAWQAAKTTCVNGHPLSGDNLLIGHKGWRRCRTCRNNYNRESARRRAKERQT